MFNFWTKKTVVNDKPWKSGYFYYKIGEGPWNDIKDNNKIDYVLEESRIYFANILDNRNRLLQKELFLLTLTAGLIGFAYNGVISQINYFIENLELLLMIGVYSVILLWSFFGLAIHQLPFLDCTPGNPPKNLLALEDPDIKNMMKYDYERIIVRQLEDCQGKINQNEERNNQISQDIKFYFWLITVSTIISGITFTFYYYLSPPACY